jgi:hypothetical protein
LDLRVLDWTILVIDGFVRVRDGFADDNVNVLLETQMIIFLILAIVLRYFGYNTYAIVLVDPYKQNIM